MNIVNPQKIEEKSFEIIAEELGDRVPDKSIRDIVLRLIHTTADFEYADLLEIKNGALGIAEKTLENKKVYCDTSMLVSGINSGAAKRAGLDILNYVHDPDVIESAHKNKTTRSIEGIKKAIREGVRVYAIGNAPTALFTLIEATLNGQVEPELIIAAPIGFVGAAESKSELDELDKLGIPYIRINGRKGGSAVAATILNALLYRKGREW